MSKKKHIPGTTVVVTSLPQGRDLAAELLGAEAIVLKLESIGTKHMHTIDTVRSVGGKRRFVLMPGTCLKNIESMPKRKQIEKDSSLISDEKRDALENKLDFISEELKAWPLPNMDPDSATYEEVWMKRINLHSMRIKIMRELYS